MIRVLFVCLGNICRSPTAQGVFEAKLREAGLDGMISADSAGTGDWHLGEPPDPRAATAARARGIEIGHLRARKAEPEDFLDFDLILAMDRENRRALERLAGSAGRGKIKMFLDFAPGAAEDVPDPYIGGAEGFEHVLDLCERAAEGLLDHLVRAHGLQPARRAEPGA